jgi:hypothetical protein
LAIAIALQLLKLRKKLRMSAAAIEQGHHMAALQGAFGEMYADELRAP